MGGEWVSFENMAQDPVITLSTSYFHRRISDGYEMMCKAAEYGFKYVELGHSTTVGMVDGIMRAAGEGVVKVASLHNFCPVPPFAQAPAPNLFSPATSSRRESDLWMRHTLNTLALAESVGAGRMVMHSGALSYFFFNPVGGLLSRFERLREAREAMEAARAGGAEGEGALEGGAADAEKKLADAGAAYASSLRKFVAGAERKAAAAHGRIMENLKLANEKFSEKGVLIGVENRDGFAELPFDTMFADFARECSSLSNVRAWIDIGHAQIKSLRGVIDLEAFLDSLRGLVCGWHLHDCTDSCRDHRGIGKGSIDFSLVKKYFDPASQIFTLEINPRVDEADVADSLKRVEDMF